METVNLHTVHCTGQKAWAWLFIAVMTEFNRRSSPSNLPEHNFPHQSRLSFDAYKQYFHHSTDMPLHPVFKAGSTALITGAASGIGLAVAKLCHRLGMKIALVDRNTEALSKARSQFDNGGPTKTYAMDVSKMDEWTDLRVKVEMDFGQVSFLMLNAGIGLNSGWEDTQYFHKVTSSCSLTIHWCADMVGHR